MVEQPDAENLFKIDAELVLKEFNCTICLNAINDCHITRCGHVFCKECILEAINRHHKCPYCQQALVEQDVFKNYHFNYIKKVIMDEKERQTKAFLNKIFDESFANKNQNEFSSPLEKLFKEYLKDIMIQFQTRYLENLEKFKQKKEYLQHKLTHDTNKVVGQINDELNITQEELNKKNQKYKEDCLQLDEQLQIINKYYLESLEQSLKQAAPSPDLLDIRVQLLVPQKKIHIQSYYIKPIKCISEFKEELYEYFLKINNPIVQMQDQEVYLLSIPIQLVAEQKPHIEASLGLKGKELYTYLLDNFANNNQISLAPLNSKDVFVKMRIQQGSMFYVLGEIKFKSDLPVECMTYNFANEMVLDYFSCVQCKINWICQNCSDYCHQGHQIQPFRTNHKATWACCYCCTKGQCKAINKNNKIKM